MRTSLCCLIFFTSVTFIIGICLIGVGIWALADQTIPLYPARALTADHVTITGLMISLISPIVFGFVTGLPYGILIYCMSAKDIEWKNFLAAYVIILIITVIVEIPVTILPMAFLSSNTARDLKAGLVASLNMDFRGLPNSYTDGSTISLLWDKTMIRDSCCGVNGISDFTSSYGLYASTWYSAFRSYTLSNGTTYTGASVKIPMACCLLNSQMILTNQDWLNLKSYLNRELCPLDTSYSSHANGCYNIIYAYVSSYTIAIICAESFLIFTEILALIFGFYLLFKAFDDEEIYYEYNKRRISPATTKQITITRTYNEEPMYDRAKTAGLYG